MPKIIVDGTEIETRDGIPVLQAALDAGLDVPHYCYHPGLSIVASCRLCLMEMKMRSPKSGEMEWSPKLAPSCQTPVRDGLEVRFKSEVVHEARERCMEYFLLNHPLDCPVCDQAGECYLQDYSYDHGTSESRMVDEKYVNPKKDIGPHTLLYQDRCVMCTRCVRFADEIAGTGELCIVNRGSRNEIDVFPGKPLDNPIQGNVVDVCPVGSLLDKDFLFKQRVWHLKRNDSICPGCSTGCTIHIDQNHNRVYRLKPRYNPGVNDWWMCDEGRFGFKYIHDEKRLTLPTVKRGTEYKPVDWSSLPSVIRFRFEEIAKEKGGDKLAVVLSPFASCEEAWMLIQFMRSIAAEATLVAGPTPTVEQDQTFPVGAEGDAVKFTIRKEKAPNQAGIAHLIEKSGGAVLEFEAFLEQAGKGAFAGAYVVGGYPTEWATKEVVAGMGKIEWLVVADLFPSGVTEAAAVVLPACAWAEREGSFMNVQGKVQPFTWAIDPPDGSKRDGQFLYELAGHTGLYRSEAVLEMMAAAGLEAFGAVHIPPPPPEHQH